jgi:disulfide oxidoreductase YuzD
MTTHRIVTSAKGAWKWQDAYRVATYMAAPDKHDVLRWWSKDITRKYSRPQLGKNFLAMTHGSAHRKILSVAEQCEWRLERIAALAEAGEC